MSKILIFVEFEVGVNEKYSANLAEYSALCRILGIRQNIRLYPNIRHFELAEYLVSEE